jgi:hypothetical protein
MRYGAKPMGLPEYVNHGLNSLKDVLLPDKMIKAIQDDRTEIYNHLVNSKPDSFEKVIPKPPIIKPPTLNRIIEKETIFTPEEVEALVTSIAPNNVGTPSTVELLTHLTRSMGVDEQVDFLDLVKAKTLQQLAEKFDVDVESDGWKRLVVHLNDSNSEIPLPNSVVHLDTSEKIKAIGGHLAPQQGEAHQLWGDLQKGLKIIQGANHLKTTLTPVTPDEIQTKLLERISSAKQIGTYLPEDSVVRARQDIISRFKDQGRVFTSDFFDD